MNASAIIIYSKTDFDFMKDLFSIRWTMTHIFHALFGDEW